MKKEKWAALLLAGVMALGMAGCGSKQAADAQTATKDDAQVTAPVQDETQNSAASGAAVNAYAGILDSYYEALSGKWDESKLLSSGLSELCTACYDGGVLQRVGYALQDLHILFSIRQAAL